MPPPYPQERRGRPSPRGRHASDVARVAPYGRDTRQECGHRPAGHRHLRGATLAARGVAWRARNPGRARARAWNRVCGAIGFEFSDARAVELMRR